MSITCNAYCLQIHFEHFFQHFVWLCLREWSTRQKKSSSVERHVARHAGQPQRSWERSVRAFCAPLKVQKKRLWMHSARVAMPSKQWTDCFRSAQTACTEGSRVRPVCVQSITCHAQVHCTTQAQIWAIPNTVELHSNTPQEDTEGRKKAHKKKRTTGLGFYRMATWKAQ